MLFNLRSYLFNRYIRLMLLLPFLLTLLALLFIPGRSRADHGAPPLNQNSPLGTNLMRVIDFSGDWPFVDAFKASRPWIALRNGQTVTGTLDLDAHGWVRSLSAGSAPPFTAVRTHLFTGYSGHYPAGQYVVLYEGEGTLRYGGDAQLHAGASIQGRQVLTVTPATAGIIITMTATDPNGTGNYLRNIRVIMPDFAESYVTQIFHPLFLEKLQPFKVLRFMDWMQTNHSTQSEWVDRPQVDDARYSTTDGVPLEIMIALSNRLHAAPWFPMPHMATDEYVTNFATLVRDTLSADLSVYVDYSNEVWNGMFSQRQWVEQRADAVWPGDLPLNRKRNEWVGRRTAEICDIWKGVWGAQSERVICVLDAQATNATTATQALTCLLWTEGRPCVAHGIDALAIAPYFGGHAGEAVHANTVVSWTQTSDGGLATLFTELATGAVLTTNGGALPQVYAHIAHYVQVAATHNLPLITYEGGQHLVGMEEAQQMNPALTQLFTTANRDARMGELYTQYLTQWQALGGQLFMHHTNTRRYTQSGSFGALEYADQATSPKYTALTQFIQQHPCWWPDCIGVATPTPTATNMATATPTTTLSPTVPVMPTREAYLPLVAGHALATIDLLCWRWVGRAAPVPGNY